MIYIITCTTTTPGQRLQYAGAGRDWVRTGGLWYCTLRDAEVAYDALSDPARFFARIDRVTTEEFTTPRRATRPAQTGGLKWKQIGN